MSHQPDILQAMKRAEQIHTYQREVYPQRCQPKCHWWLLETKNNPTQRLVPYHLIGREYRFECLLLLADGPPSFGHWDMCR